MPSDDNSFEERLKRIQMVRGGMPQAGSSASRLASTKAQSQPRQWGVMWYLMFSPLIAVVAGGAFLFATGGLDQLRGLVALDRFVEVTSADAPSPGEPGLFESLLGANPTEGATQRDPTSFLPEPPKHWVRVNRFEASNPDALRNVEAAWPADAVLGLKDSLGYNQLINHIESYSREDIEEKVLSKTRTRAIYLKSNGEFLWVTLEFLSENAALGSINDPASWIDSLAAREAKKREIGEILERNRLAGIEVTNRTAPTGKSLIRRPINEDYDVPNGIKIAVPLTARAILRIEGMATPRDAEAFISTFNRDDLAARLSE